MEQPNSNTYALVIGGSRGLGLATVQKLLGQGIPVIAIHRDRRILWPEVQKDFEALSSLPAKFHSIQKDAIKPQARAEIITEIQSILGRSGKIRILVHSLARGNLKPMNSPISENTLTESDFAITGEAMATNLYGWIRSMEENGLFSEDVRVIAFTSEGSRKVLPGYGAVAAAKASLEAIVRQIAVEFAPRGIRANCIQAGVTDTDSLRMIPESNKILEASLVRNPFQRLTLPKDVANAVYLLCLPEASWITGNILKVDGGESLR
jgi:enoyl-[acyl-carrier protein] reductase III